MQIRLTIMKKIVSFILVTSLLLTGTVVQVNAECYPETSKCRIEVKYNSTGDNVEKIIVHFAYYDNAFKDSKLVGTTLTDRYYNVVFTDNPDDVNATTEYKSGASWDVKAKGALYSDNSAQNVIINFTGYEYVQKEESYVCCMEGDFEFSDTSVLNEINANPNKTYYTMVMSGDSGGKWYIGSYAKINLSEYRHQINFNYQGHGSNFILPVKNKVSIKDSASSTNSDYNESSIISGDVKSVIDNWNTIVVNPVTNGYIFRGWYTDSECTVPADFESLTTQSAMFYAKWDKKRVSNRYILTVPADITNEDTIVRDGYVTLKGNLNVSAGDIDEYNCVSVKAELSPFSCVNNGEDGIINYTLKYEDGSSKINYPSDGLKWTASDAEGDGKPVTIGIDIDEQEYLAAPDGEYEGSIKWTAKLQPAN